MPDDTQELRRLIAELTERVYRLEQLAGVQPTTPGPEVPKARTPNHARHRAVVPRAEGVSASLESRIGSQWFNRLGIIAVLVGVSYFLKFAFENNWIGPAGRIAAGLLAGVAVVAWSERFRSRGHIGFSWSLKALGIGTMYLSLWAAFQIYHLLSATTALAAMVVVTASTAALAIAQDAQVLAALALLGGFATPLLLSTGENHELVLFCYVAMLDAATLVLLAARPWGRVLIGSFTGTLILYVAWYDQYYSGAQLGTTLLFATLFFLMFAVAPMFCVPGRDQKSRQAALALAPLPLLNAAAYFLQSYLMLEDVSKPTLAWMAVGLAALHSVLGREAGKRVPYEYGPRLLRLIYLAVAVGFLTTSIPLALETHWITIGWLVEAAALMWISYRAPSPFLRALASGALVLGIGRLLIFDNFHPAHLVLNARFATYLIAIGSLAMSAMLAFRVTEDERQRDIHRVAAGLAIVAINVLALLALNLEVRDCFARSMQALQQLNQGRALAWVDVRQFVITRGFTYSAVLMFYGAALMWVGFWRRASFLRWQALVLLAITAIKVFVYDVSELERGYRIISLIALGVLLLAVSFVYQRDWLMLSPQRRAQQGNNDT